MSPPLSIKGELGTISTYSSSLQISGRILDHLEAPPLNLLQPARPPGHAAAPMALCVSKMHVQTEYFVFLRLQEIPKALQWGRRISSWKFVPLLQYSRRYRRWSSTLWSRIAEEREASGVSAQLCTKNGMFTALRSSLISAIRAAWISAELL